LRTKIVTTAGLYSYGFNVNPLIINNPSPIKLVIGNGNSTNKHYHTKRILVEIKFC